MLSVSQLSDAPAMSWYVFATYNPNCRFSAELSAAQ